LLKAHDDLEYRSGSFPCSEQAASEVLSLLMYPELTSEQIEYVANSIAAFEASVAGRG
jgi:dTDP-4-amino-4,6-dideoxygalactose transaminase